MNNELPIMMVRRIPKAHVQAMVKALRDAGLTVDKVSTGYQCMSGKTELFHAMTGRHDYLVRMRRDLFEE